MSILKQWPMYFVGRILPAAISFFGIALYTHKVAPGNFGTYSLLLAVSFFVGTTLFGGLRTAVLRMFGSLLPQEQPDFLATVLAIFTVASLFVALIISVALRLSLPTTTPWLIALTALSAISYALFELNIVICQAKLLLRTYGALQASRAIVALASTLLILRSGLRVEALMGGYVLGNCVAIGTLYNFKPMFHGRPRSAILKRIFHFGWPTSFASLAGISVTLQRFFLERFGGAAALGIFAVADGFAGQSVGLLIGTAAITGQPLAFRARDTGDHDFLRKQLLDNARLILTIAIGSATGLAALAGPVSAVCFGSKFQNNAWQLISLASATALVGGIRASIFEQGFEIVLETRPLALLTWARVAFYLPISAVMIHAEGAIGAGEASLITELLVFTITAVWVRKFIVMPIPWSSLRQMLFAAACMAVAVQFTPWRNKPLGLALAISLGALIYGGLCLSFLVPGVFRHVRLPWRRIGDT